MIATVTLNPAIDYTATVDRRFDPGSVLRTDDVRYDAGGKGINVSKYLVALGVDTVATGLIGGIPTAFLTAQLARDGVLTDFVEIDGTTRLNTTVLAADGEYKINQDGPTVSPDVVDDVIAVLREHDPRSVVVAGSLPPGLDAPDVDRIARAGNWTTDVDLAGDLLHRLEADYGVCKPNRAELAAATGDPVGTVDDCLRAARRLQRDGFERVVASLGADGAVLAAENELLHSAAVDEPIVDTVGAGDALFAGVLASLLEGESNETALRTGVTGASKAVSVSGTRVPRMEDTKTDLGDVSVARY